MNYLFGMLVVVLVLAAIGGVVAKRMGLLKPAAGVSKLTYRRKEYLLSKAERSFYEVLAVTVDSRLMVFPKIRLLDLVEPLRGAENRQALRNRVQSKHVDFVLCDRAALRPVLVVELDDASHQRQNRKDRDASLDSILASAGLPILHMRAERGYTTSELKQKIASAIGQSPAK